MYKKLKYIIILFVVFSAALKPQNDLSIVIKETDINKVIDALIEARGLNFGN